MAEPAQKKARTSRTFLFSSESVNEGHPDKICDQVSDAVLDACLKVDPKSKVACETATKDNMVMVAGEITTEAKLDYDKVVRGVVAQIGFDSFVDDLSSVDSKGLSHKSCEVLVRINKQSPDIAGGVHVNKEDLDVGAGDQGIMFGYASDETSDCMPLTHSMATRLGKTLTDVRKSGECWWLRPDGKTQVTIEYLQHPDGSVEPKKIHTVVISTQHAEPLKAVRSKECEGYKGAEMTAPSMEQMNKEIEEKVIKRTLEQIKLKNGQPAISLYGSHTHLHINPSGKFIIGGPQGDAGLTGRKIIIDTYGGWGAHGGGAFSGKDPTKVDRSAAYICRQMAKSVVSSGLSARCLVQLSYAIGVAKPLSLFVETYGSEKTGLTVNDITSVLKIEFDCRPRAIAQSLALREPKYQDIMPSSSTEHQPEDSFAELLSRRTQLDDSFEDIGPEGAEEYSVEELTEWAQREKLGTKFVSAIPEVVQNGGLRKVTDKFLFEDLKIRLTPMRRNILEAIRRKLAGNKQVRFGEVEKLEPILHKRPKFTKCPWVDLAEIEEGHDKETLQAAMTTWRFCATGVDGLEETSLMREVFEAWKPKPKGIFEMFQAFFVSMPCCCREKPLQ